MEHETRKSTTLRRNSISQRVEVREGGRKGEKKILIVLNAVAAANSAIKGSAIKGSEAANGEEVFSRETAVIMSRERMSQCPPSCRAVDKCTRNLTPPAPALSLSRHLYSTVRNVFPPAHF